MENIQEGEKEEKEEKENLAKHEKNVEDDEKKDSVDICVYIGDGLKKIDLFFCCAHKNNNNGFQQTKHYSYRGAGVGGGTG